MNPADPYCRLVRDSGHGALAVLRCLGAAQLPRLGAWCLQTITTLPDNRKNAAGYRDLRLLGPESGPAGANASSTAEPPAPRWQWQWPRSNAAERIGVFLGLNRILGDPRFLAAARHYADAFFDPVYGLYDGPEEEGRGQVYYWAEAGFYMTNYTMRVPPYFLQLHEATGDCRYRDAALMAGEALLRMQQENGILCEGFIPRHPVACDCPRDPDETANWVTNYKINSRIGWCVYAFAVLFRHTGDARYAAALEKLSYALMRFQNPDGSFPQDLALRRYRPISPVVKNHFQGYILNGVAQTLRLYPDTPHLAAVGRKLTSYVVANHRRSWGWPYGNINGAEVQEPGGWRSSGAEVALGLKVMSDVTGDHVFRESAAKLLVQAMFNALDMPEAPDLDGAVPMWYKPGDNCGQAAPSLDGYYHFHAVLALLEMLAE